MCKSLLVFVVINFFQVFASREAHIHHVHKRTPQNIDIQSISQKQLTPDITVVDVVVNEPNRGRYPNQNQYIQPGYPRPTNNYNYYPNGQYQNTNRRQPEIQIIEVVDPKTTSNTNFQPWQGYPVNQGPYNPYNTGRYQGNNQVPVNPNVYPGNRRGGWRHRPNRRPYRPTPDFFIPEDDQDNNLAPSNWGNRRPGHRDHGHRPRPNKDDNKSDESEEERYIFDAGEGTITGYTKDNFPIIPLHKNDIRR